ncbi:MAG: hypothetical protein FJ379_04620 [Verrucomicrobia bacterium]|nr:hypothetical protein [Verrucomicrobiota bacterium]
MTGTCWGTSAREGGGGVSSWGFSSSGGGGGSSSAGGGMSATLAFRSSRVRSGRATTWVNGRMRKMPNVMATDVAMAIHRPRWESVCW